MTGVRRRRAALSYIWVSPAILLYAVFAIVPLVAGVYLAMLRWDGLDPAVFVGFDNFERMLNDNRLHEALKHNVQYAIGTVIGKNLLAIALALVLNRAMRGRAFYRTALFLPVVMSFVVVGILWTWIYNDDFGLVNNLFRSVGLGGLTQDWLGDTKIALWSLIVVDIWKWYGFHMVIYLAGLQTIPQEYYEASRLDGASRFRQLMDITFPLLKSVMVVNITISLLGAMNVFDIPYVMTEGGPANSTNVVALHTYLQAFKFNRLGYGSAISYAMFALISVIALIQLKLMSRNQAEY